VTFSRISQAHSWIQNAATASGGGGANPFLMSKGDSGFISPACTSNNQSASSEDSAENHADREHSPEADSAPAAVVKSAGEEEEDEDEEAEGREVSKLLAGAAKGTNLDELMKSARDTPTPPVDDDNGKKERNCMSRAGNIALFCTSLLYSIFEALPYFCDPGWMYLYIASCLLSRPRGSPPNDHFFLLVRFFARIRPFHSLLYQKE
jgi:hypothetical protein